jgi:Domain of unknown function (DUF4286)
MLIYNVTIKVDAAIAAPWLKWMKEEHIPQVLATGCFVRAQMVKLLETDETDGPTYAVQYYAESRGQYDKYIATYADALRQSGVFMWGDRFAAFRTLMELVN